MPRKPRIEIAGGLYHVISRGNNRRKIFRSREDYLRFTNILGQQKSKTPFFLYAYCLMPNHFHLLIEMQDEAVSRIMQRVLTTYSKSHNRKYKEDRAPVSRSIQIDTVRDGQISGRTGQVHTLEPSESKDGETT